MIIPASSSYPGQPDSQGQSTTGALFSSFPPQFQRLPQALDAIQADEFERRAALLVGRLCGEARALRIVRSYRQDEIAQPQQLRLF